MRELSHSRAVLLMVATALMWSTAGVVTRHLEHARSFEVTFWRSLFTLLALLVILPAMQGRTVFAAMRKNGRAPWISGLCWGVMVLWGRRRKGGVALWISGLCWCVMFTAFMLAIMLMPVANVLLTMAAG